MELHPGDRVPVITGIDSAELLERVSEDLELFWEVLGDFSDTYRDIATQLATELERDSDSALRLVHTLKGVLGNLAATELFDTCKALHEALRHGQTEHCAEYLSALSAGIPALCDAIILARHATTAADQPAPAPGVDGDWSHERYAALQTALSGHRARDAKVLIEEILAAGLPAAERSFCDELHLFIRSYRFQEALQLLDRHLNA